MVQCRGFLLLSVLLIAVFTTMAVAKSTPKDVTEVTDAKEQPQPVIPSRTGVRAMRAAKPAPQQRTTVQQPLATRGTVKAASPAPATAARPGTPERQYEQQVLVVKGNPSEEKLNEEIRKAIRALLGPEQGDQVQIRELKNEEELRRVAPGARPIGVRLVQ